MDLDLDSLDEPARAKIHLGLSKGGMGLRATAKIAPIAYVASVMASARTIRAAVPRDAGSSPHLTAALTEAVQTVHDAIAPGHQALEVLPDMSDLPAALAKLASEAIPPKLQNLLTKAMEEALETRLDKQLRTKPRGQREPA